MWGSAPISNTRATVEDCKIREKSVEKSSKYMCIYNTATIFCHKTTVLIIIYVKNIICIYMYRHICVYMYTDTCVSYSVSAVFSTPNWHRTCCRGACNPKGPFLHTPCCSPAAQRERKRFAVASLFGKRQLKQAGHV